MRKLITKTIRDDLWIPLCACVCNAGIKGYHRHSIRQRLEARVAWDHLLTPIELQCKDQSNI